MRDRTEIIAQILASCTRKRRKTSVRHRTNLNYGQLQAYLKLLTTLELLEHNSGEYVTTAKGQRFLQAFAQLETLLKGHVPAFDNS